MTKSSWDIIDLVHIATFVNLIFKVFIIFYEYAKKIICIWNKGIIGLGLSFNVVLSLVV